MTNARKYRLKGEVTALRYQSDEFEEMYKFIDNNEITRYVGDSRIEIADLGLLRNGDWLVKHPGDLMQILTNGEFHSIYELTSKEQERESDMWPEQKNPQVKEDFLAFIEANFGFKLSPQQRKFAEIVASGKGENLVWNGRAAGKTAIRNLALQYKKQMGDWGAKQ